MDNIYSHRSTQKYKRKPFVSHYWDCRLKGRPPGTAKSDDPNKKKRKRQARERDQCDVKIKVTEYFPGARAQMSAEENTRASSNGNLLETDQSMQQVTPSTNSVSRLDSISLSANYPGADGRRYYTIQRVNGNGANGKTDSVMGGHRHSIEESDRIKKNSIYRHFLKEEKERRKSSVSAWLLISWCLQSWRRGFRSVEVVGSSVQLYLWRLLPLASLSPFNPDSSLKTILAVWDA